MHTGKDTSVVGYGSYYFYNNYIRVRGFLKLLIFIQHRGINSIYIWEFSNKFENCSKIGETHSNYEYNIAFSTLLNRMQDSRLATKIKLISCSCAIVPVWRLFVTCFILINFKYHSFYYSSSILKILLY